MKFNETLNYASSLTKQDFMSLPTASYNLALYARYLLTSGLTESEAQDNINEIALDVFSIMPDYAIAKRVENIMKRAVYAGSLTNPSINISKKELDIIHSIGNLYLEKTMFVILCDSKLSEFNESTFKNKELMHYACNPYNNDQCRKGLRELDKTYGLLTVYSKRNSLLWKPSSKLLKAYNPDDIVLTITDFKNLAYYYLDYIGEGKFFVCPECGCIEKRKTNNQCYCKQCAKDVHVRKTIENRNKKNKMLHSENCVDAD